MTISYLGGLWVLIEFKSSDVKKKFSQHVGVGSWFTTLHHANSKFISDERIVWVDIQGIPLHAWTPNTFRKIGLKWGEVMATNDPVVSDFNKKKVVC